MLCSSLLRRTPVLCQIPVLAHSNAIANGPPCMPSSPLSRSCLGFRALFSRASSACKSSVLQCNFRCPRCHEPPAVSAGSQRAESARHAPKISITFRLSCMHAAGPSILHMQCLLRPLPPLAQAASGRFALQTRLVKCSLPRL